MSEINVSWQLANWKNISWQLANLEKSAVV